MPYVDEISFSVADHLYYFDTDKSSASYEAGKGLAVQLAEGDTMHFNAVIDMNTLRMQDILLEAFATPPEKGRFDFQRLYFTFTDVEDPSKTLTISARHSASSDDSPYTYAMAAGNGQLLTGVELFGGQLKIHVEGTSNYGRPFPHSFKDSSAGTIVLRYAPDTMQAYAGNQLIADLNDPATFSNLWEGFTSGRVRLSITGGMYEGAVGRFCIKSLKDVDLSAGELIDTKGPDITVQCPFVNNMPAALKGSSYRIYPATARDANTGVCQVKTTVWYNYTANNAVMVDVVDGVFATDYVGTYAIVYEASDRLGNKSTQVLWVNSYEEIQKPSITLNQEADTQLELGELLLPLTYRAVSHSGDAQVTITAKFGDEVYDIADGRFRPENAGDYLITYTVKDYPLYAKTASGRRWLLRCGATTASYRARMPLRACLLHP